MLKDRVTIIDEENMSGLIELYGSINFEDLQRIVNKHIKVAIDEIREDIFKSKNIEEFNRRYPYRSQKDFEEC